MSKKESFELFRELFSQKGEKSSRKILPIRKVVVPLHSLSKREAPKNGSLTDCEQDKKRQGI
ncbi:MAG: hypothetical protein IJP82_01700, partial [Bacteroidaceae bacterium]|nr:hypothetical protein [Bacteroidaceae bacterium]